MMRNSISLLQLNDSDCFSTLFSILSKKEVLFEGIYKQGQQLQVVQSVTMNDSVIILSRHESTNKKFKTRKIHLNVRFKEKSENSEIIEDVHAWMTKCFDDILQTVTREFDPEFLIGVKIGIVDNVKISPVGLSYRTISSLNGEIISDLLGQVIQSNDTFSNTDLINLELSIIEVPQGSGGQRVLLRRLNEDNLLKHKRRSLIVPKFVKEQDTKCLPRAIVLAMAHADKMNYYEMKNLLRNNSKLLEKRTDKLIKKCHINVHNENGCFLNELIKVSKKYKEYQFVVYNSMNDCKSILYKTIKTKKRINLLHITNHFIAIKSLKGLFGYRYQCNDCDNLYNNPKTHKCSSVCNYCRQLGPCPSVAEMFQCEQCNRRFRGEVCFMRHIKAQICKKIRICGDCTKFINGADETKKHICSDKYCNICNCTVSADHKCYIQQYSKEPPKKFCIIFFDLECTQNSPVEHSITGFTHKPILCVAQQICHLCFDDDDLNVRCINCKQREHIFELGTCVEEFVNFCDNYRPYACNNVCVIAHNFKSYDGHFIMNELMKRDKSVKPVMNGLKILTVLYDNYIRFIDSINFIPIALRKFPKTFGLDNIEKGFYPHLFNTFENYDYVGSIPAMSYFFEYTIKNAFDSLDFVEWHMNYMFSGAVYNNREEMIKYCKIDVNLLRKGCTRYMIDFLDLTNFNPFLQAITLAQTVMCVYRKNFMERDSLGVIPHNNYSLKINQSFIGEKWLIYQNKDADGRIEFDVRLEPSGLLVDGYDKLSNTVYEFQVKGKRYR